MPSTYDRLDLPTAASGAEAPVQNPLQRPFDPRHIEAEFREEPTPSLLQRLWTNVSSVVGGVFNPTPSRSEAYWIEGVLGYEFRRPVARPCCSDMPHDHAPRTTLLDSYPLL